MHPELSSLLDYVLRLAKQAVRMEGMCPPFGAVWTRAGTCEFHAFHPGSLAGPMPGPEAIRQRFLADFRRETRERSYRAIAVCECGLVQLPGGTFTSRGLLVHLEHREGECLEVLLPYRRLAAGEPHYDEQRVRPGHPEVFMSPDPPGP